MSLGSPHPGLEKPCGLRAFTCRVDLAIGFPIDFQGGRRMDLQLLKHVCSLAADLQERVGRKLLM